MQFAHYSKDFKNVASSTSHLRHIGSISSTKNAAQMYRGLSNYTKSYDRSLYNVHKAHNKTYWVGMVTPSLAPSASKHGGRSPYQSVRYFASSPTDPDGIIPTLGKIQKITGHSLSYPRIVVIGNQSAGKSSVLEAVVGESFLPKGTNMVTRRPLEMTLVRDDMKYFQFENGQKLHDIEAVKEKLHEENKDYDFTEIPIKMEVHSPDVQNVTLVDLPGYIHAVTRDQAKDLPKKIQKLARSYIENENNIVLVVVSAAEDTAISMGLKEAHKLADWSTRTMGVLTKIDLRNTKDLIKTLTNAEYPLGLGYVGVRCRTDKELDEKITFNDLIKREEEFIKSKKLHLQDVKVGIPTLREELSKELLHRISKSFPTIIDQLNEKIDKAKTDEHFLQTISAEKDLTNVAKELEKLVMQFHPNAPTRLEFEKSVRENTARIVDHYFDKAMNTYYGALKVETPNAWIETQPNDATVRKHAANILSALGVSQSTPIRGDFSTTMIYGESTPDKVDDAFLKSQSEYSAKVGGSSAFYQLVFPENYQAQRLDWQRNLTEAVGSLAPKGELPEACRKEAIDNLLRFVEKAAVGSGKSEASQHLSLAKYFFRYLVERIAERTAEDNLTSNIQTMLNREKRANCTYPELAVAIRNNIPVGAEHANSMFHRTKYPVPVYVYSSVYTKSYFDVLKKRVADDIFRVLAVELINPLIFETINYSLNLFKSGKIFREAGKQLKFIKELTAYRDIISKAAEKYKIRHPGGVPVTTTITITEKEANKMVH